jgi:SAM-dependent methyltransferase
VRPLVKAAERLASAWRTLAAAPDDLAARVRVATLLQRVPQLIDPAFEPLYASLLADPAIDPRMLERAGWALLSANGRLPEPGTTPEGIARWLESDETALTLLAATHLTYLPAEQLLTTLRRWLLLEQHIADYPNATQALLAQAAHNGGAWPFAEDERTALGSPFAAAYLPPRPRPKAATFAAPVTRAVSEQYEAWPYPAWQRATRNPTDTLAARIAALRPDAPTLPDHPEILVAGCGTGRDAALWAHRAPQARVTAIDLSATSLAYAAERAAAMALTNLEFRHLDLHDAATLGRGFDFIASSGVLHHLADPEAGWAALTQTLKPGGVMRIMLYSKVARLVVQSARHAIADLLDQPVTDDLIRAVRARLLAEPPHAVTASADFYHMGGVHDLLLHAHEDAFDIPRIRRAIEAQGLTLLGFDLPEPAASAYAKSHPQDPHRRNYAAWIALERANPRLFGGMYGFWVAKPL